ncbi:16S rRNA (cytidine(1402)-2'-O)-methyltransferase [bacterium]|nr:16S rRNA (cytidine(1402)-2'-O)-methyltransferase [bacterium]
MEENKLYVVATPIGNLEDVSSRAMRVLQEADLIITENQPTTRKLFSLLNLNISGKRLVTFADFNSKQDLPKVIELLKNTKNSALVSEAGTPLISDPGYEIISFIRANKLEIEILCVPGASSIISHLSISGLPTNNFMFVGFLPKKIGKCTKTLNSFNDINNITKTTFVILESKHRLEKTLKLIFEVYPTCLVSLGLELTKKFERVYYGNIEEVLKTISASKVSGEAILHLQLLPNETSKN